MSTNEVEQKRQAILAAYPNSRSWPGKVAKMHDAQVVRVYMELQSRGKLR